MPEEVIIESLGAFIDHITPAIPDHGTGRRRDTGVYHGAVDAQAPLLTSLDRLGGISPPHTKIDLEAHILRNFIRYSRPFIPASATNDWEFLIAAQHHGVPTRLLDWTYSPLVAAFFATRPGDRQLTEPLAETRAPDRVVWRLDWHSLHETFNLTHLALRIEDLSTLFGTQEALTPWHLFDAHNVDRTFACLIEPPSLDDRIVAQASTFSLCSARQESFDHFLIRHGLDSALTKFIIPRHAAATIRDQLDLVGIDERRLFPDLDGIAAALRRYYM